MLNPFMWCTSQKKAFGYCMPEAVTSCRQQRLCSLLVYIRDNGLALFPLRRATMYPSLRSKLAYSRPDISLTRLAPREGAR